MKNKIVVDTNILVYGIDENSRYYERSRKVLDNPENELLTTSKNISEFLTVITRQPPKGYGIKIKIGIDILQHVGMQWIFYSQHLTLFQNLKTL